MKPEMIVKLEKKIQFARKILLSQRYKKKWSHIFILHILLHCVFFSQRKTHTEKKIKLTFLRAQRICKNAKCKPNSNFLNWSNCKLRRYKSKWKADSTTSKRRKRKRNMEKKINIICWKWGGVRGLRLLSFLLIQPISVFFFLISKRSFYFGMF